VPNVFNTIFPKDTDLLRDIIFAFDPENGLGRPSAERKETRDRHRVAEQRKLKQKIAAATAMADSHCQGGSYYCLWRDGTGSSQEVCGDSCDGK